MVTSWRGVLNTGSARVMAPGQERCQYAEVKTKIPVSIFQCSLDAEDVEAWVKCEWTGRSVECVLLKDTLSALIPDHLEWGEILCWADVAPQIFFLLSQIFNGKVVFFTTHTSFVVFIVMHMLVYVMASRTYTWLVYTMYTTLQYLIKKSPCHAFGVHTLCIICTLDMLTKVSLFGFFFHWDVAKSSCEPTCVHKKLGKLQTSAFFALK